MSGLHRSPRRVAPQSPEASGGAAGASTLGVDEIFANPGLLKLELMVHGVTLDPELWARRRDDEAYRNYFVATRDIELVLPEGTHVAAPVGPSPYVLREVEGRYEITVDAAALPPGRRRDEPPGPLEVGFVAPSAFYTQRTKRGVPLSAMGSIRGSYLALSPTSTCAFLGGPQQCSFCSLSEVPAAAAIEVDDILEAVGAARQTDGVDVVYLSTGYAARPDAGVADLEPFVRAIKHRFDVLVAVDALPPHEDAWVDRTYAMGADAVSYNLEIWEPEAFERICPGPAQLLGRDRFVDTLRYAVGVFPAGAVICHLMVGMEPLESTAAGVDALVADGVVPVLPLFRPFKGLDMRLRPDHAAEVKERLRTEALAGLYGLLYRRVRARRIPTQWARHVSVATTPLEGRFFAGEDARLQVFLDRMARTRFGRVARARLADLRRILRVRQAGLDAP